MPAVVGSAPVRTRRSRSPWRTSVRVTSGQGGRRQAPYPVSSVGRPGADSRTARRGRSPRPVFRRCATSGQGGCVAADPAFRRRSNAARTIGSVEAGRGPAGGQSGIDQAYGERATIPMHPWLHPAPMREHGHCAAGIGSALPLVPLELFMTETTLPRIEVPDSDRRLLGEELETRRAADGPPPQGGAGVVPPRLHPVPARP